MGSHDIASIASKGHRQGCPAPADGPRSLLESIVCCLLSQGKKKRRTRKRSQLLFSLPWSSFPCFFLLQGIPCFLSVFPFFFRAFRGSARITQKSKERKIRVENLEFPNFRAARRGGFKRKGFPELDLFVPICPFFPFWTFPIFVSGFFPICPSPLSQPIQAPTRDTPESVCDTIGTFPEKRGKSRILEPPPV